MNNIVAVNRIVPARVGSNCVNKIVTGEQNRSKYEQNSPREQDSPREQNSPVQLVLYVSKSHSPVTKCGNRAFLDCDTRSPLIYIRTLVVVLYAH